MSQPVGFLWVLHTFINSHLVISIAVTQNLARAHVCQCITLSLPMSDIAQQICPTLFFFRETSMELLSFSGRYTVMLLYRHKKSQHLQSTKLSSKHPQNKGSLASFCCMWVSLWSCPFLMALLPIQKLCLMIIQVYCIQLLEGHSYATVIFVVFITTENVTLIFWDSCVEASVMWLLGMGNFL